MNGGQEALNVFTNFLNSLSPTVLHKDLSTFAIDAYTQAQERGVVYVDFTAAVMAWEESKDLIEADDKADLFMEYRTKSFFGVNALNNIDPNLTETIEVYDPDKEFIFLGSANLVPEKTIYLLQMVPLALPLARTKTMLLASRSPNSIIHQP